ncbi:lysozyme inhibitor LprI family protein [Paracidovorax avenae]|uniref:lysozyme inhibitor LprI family protein n=1 Tax=Paracidovorax avenae TaxID=80867 RepID=UPI001F32C231|nr:lysozyme inhibitor LprI family protein [Paracidovorax avenae]
MASLLSGNEGGDLILPPNWKSKLTPNTVRTIPQHNLRAGSMRKIVFRMALPAILLPASFIAASPAHAIEERALREVCSAYSQAGMRDCLSKKAADSQDDLRQARNNAISILSKWDEDAQYAGRSKVELTASDKDFEKYRDAHCKFRASLSGGGAGNSHEILRLACIAELNGTRARQLRDAVADLPLK